MKVEVSTKLIRLKDGPVKKEEKPTKIFDPERKPKWMYS